MSFYPTKNIITSNSTSDAQDQTVIGANKNQTQNGESFKELGPQEINNTIVGFDVQNDNDDTTINGVPDELLMRIFFQLDYKSLDEIPRVCHQWMKMLEGEELWIKAFQETFKTLQYGSVTNSYKWRTEFLMREKYLKNWKKKAFITSFERGYSDHYSLNVDFKSEKIVSFDSYYCEVHISGLRDMKKSLTLYNNYVENVFNSPTLTTMDCSNYAVITGLSDGSIKTALLTPGSDTWSRGPLFPPHDSPITTLILNKRQVHSDEKRASLYTASADGRIYGWNLRIKKRIEEFSIGDNKSITHITTDFKGTFVVRDVNGSIYYKSPENKLFQMVIDKNLNRWDYHYKLFMFTDFEYGYCIIIHHNRVYRYSFGTNTENQKWRCQTLDIPNIGNSFISSVSYDKRNFYSKDEKFPGDDACFSTIILVTGRIIVWNMRQKSENDKLKLFRSIRNPFIVKDGFAPICSVDNNSLVVIVGSFNGMNVVYNILTGAKLRVNKVLTSRKMFHFTEDEQVLSSYPVKNIILNEDPSKANGILIVRNVVQYFSFNEDTILKKKKNIRQGTKGFSGNSKKRFQEGIIDDIKRLSISGRSKKASKR